MVDLRIEQGLGRLGLNMAPFQHKLKIKDTELEIKQTSAQIFLQQSAPDFEIDYRPALDSLGYFGLYSGLQHRVQEANAIAQAGIERRVQEGNQLASIHEEIGISQIVEEATRLKEKDLQVTAIAPIKIRFKVTPLQWDANPGGVEVSFNRGTVRGEFQYGKIKTYLEQEPYIKYKTVGQVFDTKR